MKIRSPPHSAGHPASKALRSQQARPSVIDSVNVNRLGASWASSLRDFVHRDRLPVGIFHQPVQRVFATQPRLLMTTKGLKR